MPDLFLLLILFCAGAGIISEIITISAPERVLEITEKNPEELFNSRFYRFLLTLSGLYILVIILLLFSGNDRFRLYAVVIMCISFSGWIFRSKLKKHTCIIIAESTVSLIMLIDIVRTVVGEMILS